MFTKYGWMKNVGIILMSEVSLIRYSKNKNNNQLPFFLAFLGLNFFNWYSELNKNRVNIKALNKYELKYKHKI